ncbi:hypothetical protein MARA_33640 [Mycolicibacterium arabiense]|uniref:Uncharacterized protein n=1 Tax=Mycolicibacterium arabiense TaxID=1286181 RepID=A0A7I7S0U7_9MYCO|nr:hypothetical protein MARA_33640 [Mycolicibacterium arabiense]
MASTDSLSESCGNPVPRFFGCALEEPAGSLILILPSMDRISVYKQTNELAILTRLPRYGHPDTCLHLRSAEADGVRKAEAGLPVTRQRMADPAP